MTTKAFRFGMLFLLALAATLSLAAVFLLQMHL
jgi:hypothetical protein